MIFVILRYLRTITLIILWAQYACFEMTFAPLLTCNETIFGHLTPVSMNCNNDGSDIDYNYFKCTKSHLSIRNVVWLQELLLGVPQSDFSKNGKGLIRNDWQCMSVLSWSGKCDRLENHFLLTFDLEGIPKFIGVVRYDCKSDDEKNCSLDVKLREDVLALPPFSFTPDEPQFWNFSSPLFRPDLWWLQSLNLTGSFTYHYPLMLPGLASSSIRELCVNGSFGTDKKGPLPHFDNLPLMKTLTIINSTIDITQENLTKTTKIEDLKLLKNKFTKIPKFKANLRNLMALTFESTMENFTFSSDALSGFLDLGYLILSGNHIEQWTTADFPDVYEIRLSRCKMKRFSVAKNGSHLRSLEGLAHLYLNENFLSSLPPDVFSVINTVDTLDLSYNLFTQLPSTLFTPLRYLQNIFLQGNNLSRWPILPCNNYYIINLSQNSISNLTNLGLYIIYTNLIDISSNNIRGWDSANIFTKETTCGEFSHTATFSDHIPWAYFVNLSHNSITYFSAAMLASLSVLKEVDLGGNKINCGECKTSLLKQWLTQVNPRTTVKNLGESTPLTCNQPPELKGRPVQEVNFDEVCFAPRRSLWLAVGAFIAGVIAFVGIGSVIFCYRTEVVYLVHLAKIRATSKRKTHPHCSACYDAFICYSGKNRKWVLTKLSPTLEKSPESYVLCLFDRDFRLGTHIVTNIVDAIEHSRKVIIVLTQHFIDSKWCQWELEMAQHKLFSEDREFLVLLELEPLERRRLPRLLRFLLDTRPVVRWPRPETAPAVMAAAAELRAVLGPSLRQTLLADPPPPDEPRPSTSAADERTPLLSDEHPSV